MQHLQQVKELEVRISELQKEKEAAVMKEGMKLEVTKQTLFCSETSCSELERKLAVAYEEVHCTAIKVVAWFGDYVVPSCRSPCCKLWSTSSVRRGNNF